MTQLSSGDADAVRNGQPFRDSWEEAADEQFRL
jgi:hypothetical protein